MLSRAIKMAFWVTYDHLGKLILVNLIWSLSFLIPLMLGATAFATRDPAIMVFIGVPLTVLALGIILPVTTAGLAHLAKELIDTRDGSVRNFFAGMRLHWKRAMGIGLLYLFGVASLAVSVWFYAAKVGSAAPWLGYTISALALWCLLLVTLMAMLVMPALVQKRGGIVATLKLAALLVMDNPLFCIGLAIQFIVIAGFSAIIPVLVFLSGSVSVVLASSAYEMLARKYAQKAQDLAADPASSALGGIRGVTREGAAIIEDEQDDYLNRGLRDFLFPWKG
jgi:uncharacterized membrane protein YesL